MAVVASARMRYVAVVDAVWVAADGRLEAMKAGRIGLVELAVVV